MKIKKNDTVKVISGKEKGKEGKVLKVSIEEKRLAVEGVNIVKKHVKAKKDEKGGIIEFEKTIDLSNVMLVCPKCKKTTRVAFKIDGDKKVRLCKKCGEIIE